MRLNQSASYLGYDRGAFQRYSEGASGTNTNTSQLTQSFLPDHSRTFSQFGLQPSTLLPLERALNEAQGHIKSSQDTSNSVNAWNTIPAPIGHPYHTKDAVTSAGVTLRRERILSMPANHHNTALNPYAGNRHELTARVSSVPQHTLFGEEKYGYISAAIEPHAKIDSKIYTGRERRERHSQIDGAMDDLAEMVTPVNAPARQVFSKELLKPATLTGNQVCPQDYYKPISSSGNMDHQRSVHHHASNHARFPTDPVSPPASPSKSTSSPKKMTSPKHRIQQLARGIIGTSGGGSDRSDRSRPESPDPKKMGVEEKRRWKEDWRNKFAKLKREESDRIRKYKKENPGL
jgi:hypothetical protein